MKNILSKKTIVLLAVFIVVFPLFADNAKVTYIKGKVEVLRNEIWKPLKVGDEIVVSETVSTGFQSEAKIEYNGSIMSLGAVTRITLEQLSSSANKDNVSLYLKTGAVRSKVTHPQNHKVSYTVKTPVAVASVRGTDFTVTSNGHVACAEGAVAVYANKSSNRNSRTAAVEEEEESSEEEANEAPANEANNGPADSTTPASEIDTDAPAGAVVVAKNQEVVIKPTGKTQTPMVSAINKTEKVKNTVSTAASKEADSVGGTVVAPKPIEKEPVVPTATTGTILINVVLED